MKLSPIAIETLLHVHTRRDSILNNEGVRQCVREKLITTNDDSPPAAVRLVRLDSFTLNRLRGSLMREEYRSGDFILAAAGKEEIDRILGRNVYAANPPGFIGADFGKQPSKTIILEVPGRPGGILPILAAQAGLSLADDFRKIFGSGFGELPYPGFDELTKFPPIPPIAPEVTVEDEDMTPEEHAAADVLDLVSDINSDIEELNAKIRTARAQGSIVRVGPAVSKEHQLPRDIAEQIEVPKLMASVLVEFGSEGGQ